MPRYTSGSTWPSDSSYLGNTDLPVQEYGKQLSMEASMWVRNSTCREHPEGISLDKAKEYPWVYLSPLPEKMGCCQDSFPLLCWKPPCFSTAAVSGCPISWDTSFSHITVLALRCCGTCLRRQLVIKLEREGLWVLAFGSCPQWLTFYHSFSLWQGALHLLAVTVLGAAAEALTRIGHQQGSSTGSPPGKLIQIKQRCKADLPAVIKHSS